MQFGLFQSFRLLKRKQCFYKIHKLLFWCTCTHSFVPVLLSLPVTLLGHRVRGSSTRLCTDSLFSDVTAVIYSTSRFESSCCLILPPNMHIVLRIYLNLLVSWVGILFFINLLMFFIHSYGQSFRLFVLKHLLPGMICLSTLLIVTFY